MSMDEKLMRPPVRRRVFRCGYSGETGIDRMKGVQISARDSDASVRDAEDSGDANGAADGRAG